MLFYFILLYYTSFYYKQQIFGFVCFTGLDDSVILASDASMISQLNTWLSPKLQSAYGYWKLCYRASIDGWRSQTFHEHCDNRGATVTIVRVGRYIFGGYNDHSWQCKLAKYRIQKKRLFTMRETAETI